jgi:hypothetical protein
MRQKTHRSSRALLSPKARERIGRLYATDIKAYFS